MKDATNALPPSGGGDQGAYLIIDAAGLPNLLESPDEFNSVFYPLLRWFCGLDYVCPKGLAGALFDKLAARQLRNLEVWRNKSNAGKSRSPAKAEAVRANGCKGGRPRKAENLTETKQKPNRNLTETKDPNPNHNPNPNSNPNQEIKEIKQASMDNKQDNNIEQPQAEQPADDNVLSVVHRPPAVLSFDSFSDDDAYDVLDNPFPDKRDVALVKEAGCRLVQGEKDKEPISKADAKLRLSKTHQEAFAVIETAKEAGKPLNNEHNWSVGTLVNKAREYKYKNLNAEEMLKLLVCHFTKVFKDYTAEDVQKAVFAETPERAAVEEVAANGWRYTNGEAINDPIKWSCKVYEDCMPIAVRVASGEDVPDEEIPF